MKKCGLSVRYFLFVQFFFFLFFFAQPEKSKQCAGEHFCNIVREHLSTNEKRRSQLCFRNDVRGDVYTLNRPSTHRNPSTTTHAKKNEQHMKRESLRKTNKKNKHFKHERATIPPHVQNTLSLQYTSGKTTKTTTKKDNQNHVCILLHREALSVIRCVLLQAYSY